jgi:uncharacterized linocin/CFP29 family protein
MIMVTSMGTYPPLMATTNNYLSRNKLEGWGQEIWNRIDQAVHDEMQRTRVAMKFIPMYAPVTPGTLTIPADRITSSQPLEVDQNEADRITSSQPLEVDQNEVEQMIQIQVQFRLTHEQVMREEELRTAVTLATRAANQLAQAEDVIIFQGPTAIDPKSEDYHSLFQNKIVEHKSGKPRQGLLGAAEKRFEQVKLTQRDNPQRRKGWGENTFEAVSAAYSRLQSGRDNLNQAHYGPYALVLHHKPYADTYAPLENTLILTADRIEPLMTAGFYGTGTMREFEGREFEGIVVSLGGNTMDLAYAVDATTAVLQEDVDGFWRFRVYERFALRLKDDTAIIRLLFVDV